MSCPRTHHRNNVPRLRGEKHDISLKILHQAGFETAWQAATSAKCHAITIAPCHTLLVHDAYDIITSKNKTPIFTDYGKSIIHYMETIWQLNNTAFIYLSQMYSYHLSW